MASILTKLCSKRKVTQRANDFRAKGIMDYFGTPHESLDKSANYGITGEDNGAATA